MIIKGSFFIFHKTALDLLPLAINSLGDGIDVTIINNSYDDLSPVLNDHVREWKNIYPLNYTQTFNLVKNVCVANGDDVMFTMHDDAQFEKKEDCKRLLLFVAEQMEKNERWGQILTSHDIITAYNVAMLKEVGDMDLFFQLYYTDFDYFRRMKLLGYEVIESGIKTVHNNGGSNTIKRDPFHIQTQNITMPLYEQYYIRKWGGKINEEKYLKPFNL